ncbi:hypothetical protein F5144DRAFT_594166 [Chaetomium tenue]|uniref:Uncharacterized protein n=1 Tax=Chaetomium tenue TaxID=1854479 RepID=A0ACB7P2H1_9PEZI|nr:hypothetical protein F5144DRAFT_594166 [Chaetomium globosum]
MATTTGSSPPPQKPSSWPWSGRKRRNSESSLTSLRDFVTGRRNSLSATDVTQPNVLRKKAPEPSVPQGRPGPLPEAKKKADEKAAVVTPAVAGPSNGPQEKENKKSRSRLLGAMSAKKGVFKEDNRFLGQDPSALTQDRQAGGEGFISTFLFVAPSPFHSQQSIQSARPRNPSSAGRSPGLKPTAAPPTLRPPRSRFDGPLAAMYPTEKQEFVLRSPRASGTRMSSQPGPSSSSGGSEMGHAPMIHMPTAHPGDGPLPGGPGGGGYNTPRRLSNGSTSSVASSAVSGRDSFDGRVRAASMASSQTSFDDFVPRGSLSGGPVTWQTQNGGPGAGQNYPWQRPAPIKQRRKAQPGELFAALPGEVLELILAALRRLHLEPGSTSCATCWMRDCCSVAVSARKFVKYAREALYQHVQLVGHEGPAMKKRTKTTYGSRLVLLRRTLRANAHIAVIVRSLKPPARPFSVGAVAYNDLVASVVMACPNLERLVGYYPTYDHSFQRLFQALSTRTRLKDMNWILEPSVQQRQQRTRSPAHNDRWARGSIEPGQPAGIRPLLARNTPN